MVVPEPPEMLELEKIFSPYETNDIHNPIRDDAHIKVKEALKKHIELGKAEYDRCVKLYCS